MHIYRLLYSYRLRILFPVRIVTAAFDQYKKKKKLEPSKKSTSKKKPPLFPRQTAKLEVSIHRLPKNCK